MKLALRGRAVLRSPLVLTSHACCSETTPFLSACTSRASGGCIFSCDRVSQQSPKFVCIQGTDALLQGHHFVCSQHPWSQLERNKFTSGFESVEVQTRSNSLLQKDNCFHLKVTQRCERTIQTAAAPLFCLHCYFLTLKVYYAGFSKKWTHRKVIPLNHL